MFVNTNCNQNTLTWSCFTIPVHIILYF